MYIISFQQRRVTKCLDHGQQAGIDPSGPCQSRVVQTMVLLASASLSEPYYRVL